MPVSEDNLKKPLTVHRILDEHIPCLFFYVLAMKSDIKIKNKTLQGIENNSNLRTQEAKADRVQGQLYNYQGSASKQNKVSKKKKKM